MPIRNTMRKNKPSRKYTGRPYASYKSYKSILRSDFNERCGYCDSVDFWLGSSNSFQIDHFAPQSLFPEIIHDYRNLVYSCPYCNRSKSDKWISDDAKVNIINDEGFYDPCCDEYEQQFKRDTSGRIIPITKIGNYMYLNLKLYLERIRIIWNLERLRDIINRLLPLLANEDEIPENIELIKLHSKLSIQFHRYLEYLVSQSKQ